MPQTNSPRFERVFVGPQSALGTVPNSTGTWTTTNVKLLRSVANGCKLKANAPLTPVPWKTGTRSTQNGILGRKGGSFSLSNLPVIPSGSAGTAPDADLLFQGLFGAAPTVVAATSVTYAFADATFKPFILARFMHSLTGLTQQFAYGCTPEEASFTLNGNVFEMGMSGGAFWVLDSDNFGNEDSTGLGGLSVQPAELSSPTVTGSIINGFQGIATFDSNAMDATSAPLISAGVRIRTGNQLYTDNFGNTYPSSQGGGERAVSVSCTFQDTDHASLINLKTKAKAKTAINITLQVGTTAGSIVTFTLKNVQLNVQDFSDDNARVTTSFGESQAHASALANIDDVTIAFT